MLHTTPVIDHIGLAKISRKTSEDPVLANVSKLVKNGCREIPKQENEKVRRFQPILAELTVTAKWDTAKKKSHCVTLEPAFRGDEAGT